jgi:hypothetical protein
VERGGNRINDEGVGSGVGPLAFEEAKGRGIGG